MMDFINSTVELKNLPAAEDVSLHPVHPAYKKILQIEWVIATIVLLVLAGVLIFSNSSLRSSFGWVILAIAVIIISAFTFISIKRSFPFLAYSVRDKDVIHQKGWIVRRIKICPFNRIQNCSVQSGPLERKYGLASLIIYTAGTDSADMRISGLLQEEANRLRYFILSKIHAERDEAV
jgi:membrane protein YdbS with pleckstrin-like domain